MKNQDGIYIWKRPTEAPPIWRQIAEFARAAGHDLWQPKEEERQLVDVPNPDPRGGVAGIVSYVTEHASGKRKRLYQIIRITLDGKVHTSEAYGRQCGDVLIFETALKATDTLSRWSGMAPFRVFFPEGPGDDGILWDPGPPPLQIDPHKCGRGDWTDPV